MAYFNFCLIIKIPVRTPYKLRNEISASEYLITYHVQCICFIIINTNKDDSIFSQ